MINFYSYSAITKRFTLYTWSHFLGCLISYDITDLVNEPYYQKDHIMTILIDDELVNEIHKLV